MNDLVDSSRMGDLIRSSAWAGAARTVSMVSALVLSGFFARVLSPSEMGTYVLMISAVGLSVSISLQGMPTAAVRLIGEALGRNRGGAAVSYARLILVLGTAASIVVAILLSAGMLDWLAVRFWRAPTLVGFGYLIGFWVVLESVQKLLGELLRGSGAVRWAAVFEGSIRRPLSILLVVGAWSLRSEFGLDDSIRCLLMSAGVSVALGLSVLWRTFLSGPSDRGAVSLETIYRTSWSYWATGLSFFVISQIPIWVLSRYSADSQVALYGTAFQIVALSAIPMAVVSGVLAPTVVHLDIQKRSTELEESVRSVSTLAGLPMLVYLLGVMLFARSLLEFVYGAYYRQAGLPAFILGVGFLIHVLTGPSGEVLLFTGNQGLVLRITVAAGLVTALIGYLLVEEAGAVGVAIAASCGMALQNVLQLLAAKRAAGVWTHIRLSRFSVAHCGET